MQTIVETPSYLVDAERLFSSVERAAIVDRLAADPACGVVIPGSGGMRKVRFGFGGRDEPQGQHRQPPLPDSSVSPLDVISRSVRRPEIIASNP